MLPELDDCVLDHIAIAVNNLEDSVALYSQLGLKFNHEREEVVSQKVKTAFCQIDNSSHLELLEATSNESSIARFIAKKGTGIHHLCFRVSNLEAKQKELVDKGFKFLYDQPIIGAGGCSVNFIHPKSMGGVLIELSQKKN